MFSNRELEVTGLWAKSKRPSWGNRRDVLHSDTRKLLTHLFAEMIGRLEDASLIAGAGQSSRASAHQYRVYAQNLARVVDDLGHLARAAEALTRPVLNVRNANKKQR